MAANITFTCLTARGAVACVLVLFAVGAAAESDTRLVAAARVKDAHAVAGLLRQKADVNAREADGATALHWAALNADQTTVAVLIRAGADANAANEYGVTPLMLA